MIANLIARLKCWRYGHMRGKRLSESQRWEGAATGPEVKPMPSKGTATFQCPRCTATWTRKVKAA